MYELPLLVCTIVFLCRHKLFCAVCAYRGLHSMLIQVYSVLSIARTCFRSDAGHFKDKNCWLMFLLILPVPFIFSSRSAIYSSMLASTLVLFLHFGLVSTLSEEPLPKSVTWNAGTMADGLASEKLKKKKRWLRVRAWTTICVCQLACMFIFVCVWVGVRGLYVFFMSIAPQNMYSVPNMHFWECFFNN